MDSDYYNHTHSPVIIIVIIAIVIYIYNILDDIACECKMFYWKIMFLYVLTIYKYRYISRIVEKSVIVRFANTVTSRLPDVETSVFVFHCVCHFFSSNLTIFVAIAIYIYIYKTDN